MILKLIKDKRFILLLVCIITFFVNNNVIEPDIMESRNLVTAREMVTDGNWIVPTMNGEIRLEKPPLPTWIAAVCEYISNDNIVLQRSMSAIMASILVLFLYLIAVELFKNKNIAFISSLFLCTCYNVILTGRTATWDIFCHSFMLGAIFFFIKAFKYNHTKYYILSGLFLGLSFMSKGPVAFYSLLLPFLISFIIYKKALIDNKPLYWKIILLLLTFIISGLWWYIFIYLNHYDDMTYVANKESGSWINRNVRPWWYYWKFFLETGIWSLLLLISISAVLWYRSKCKSKEYMFILVWLVSDLILLSLFPEKKSRYLFPILIPSGYIMGWFTVNIWNKIEGVSKYLYMINSWIINIILLSIPIIAYILFFDSLNISIFTFIILSLIIWFIVVYLIIQTIKLDSVKYIYGIVFLFMVIECLVFPHLNDIINNPDMKSIKESRKNEYLTDIPFYYNKNEELRIETVYAAGKKIRPIDINDKETIKKCSPFVLITHKSLNTYKEYNNLKDFNIRYIDTYDDNKRPKSNKYYREALVNNMNLIDNPNE